MYSSLALLGFVFVVGCLPETKGLRLEEIESLFGRRLCTCGAGSQGVHYIRVKGGNYRSDEDVTDDDQ